MTIMTVSASVENIWQGSLASGYDWTDCLRIDDCVDSIRCSNGSNWTSTSDKATSTTDLKASVTAVSGELPLQGFRRTTGSKSTDEGGESWRFGVEKLGFGRAPGFFP